MKILLLPIGMKNRKILLDIREGLTEVFPRSTCTISAESLPIPMGAYDPLRRQYVSEVLMKGIESHAARIRDSSGVKRILGVTDVDLYAPGLNFIFGEAQFLGEAAIISLHRLRPEFYGAPSDWALFAERAVKEAVHEIGHTLGLRHCPDDRCVMHFSLHIGMTDRKSREFCAVCRRKAEGHADP